jgi:hypothetical protein
MFTEAIAFLCGCIFGVNLALFCDIQPKDKSQVAHQMMDKTYRARIQKLKTRSQKAIKALEDPRVSKKEKRNIVQRTISHYLTPTSHNVLFGKDMVIYYGKGNPIIMQKDDFKVIKNNWTKVLAKFNIRNLEETCSVYKSMCVEFALGACGT